MWVANNCVPEANVDAYFIYKHDTGFSDKQRLFDFGDNADIYTAGGRLSGRCAGPLEIFGGRRLPIWPETGTGCHRPDPYRNDYHNLSAIGANSKFSYLFKDSLNDQLSLSYEFLSGDNPNSKTDEMFDVLWGRWPSWSEMYNVYSYVSETRVAANLKPASGWAYLDDEPGEGYGV